MTDEQESFDMTFPGHPAVGYFGDVSGRDVSGRAVVQLLDRHLHR